MGGVGKRVFDVDGAFWMRASIILLPLLIVGCAKAPQESGEIGRFEFHPAADEMPAILLDTKTGCIESFEKLTSVNNPKLLEWRRQYMDGVWPVMKYDDDVPTPIPNSQPPTRCPKPQGALK